MEFNVNKVIQNVQNLVSQIEVSSNNDINPLSEILKYLQSFLKKEVAVIRVVHNLK